MNKRTFFALVAGAAALGAVRNRLALKEDLDWELVAKPGRLIDIDGYRVHYVDVGSGPAIVFVHGFGGQTYSYRHLIPNFAQDHRVIAVDLKGYGYSERDSECGLSNTDQVAVLKALLKRLGIESATMVGHSMGGAIIQRFAAMHPDVVESLVLAGSDSADDRVSRIVPPAFVLKPILPVLMNLTASRMLGIAVYEPSFITADVRAEYMRPLRIKGSMLGLLAVMRDGAKDGRTDLSRITHPVLLLNGAHDRLVPLSVAQRIRRQLPQARLVVIDRAGHLLLEERPDDCARAIREFLGEIRTSAGRTTAAAS